ncbi:efflux transporter outer membrane subunit [Maridesulfovibrio sp.]|uniref:efflux transporter outer membrane subunit n=1 Tax=Maridesulfovibrio sp. TaxID=2795000 RepID=UPI002A18BD79|nr:efflux transporter outer membrane subunit [Maridesulfovibrio sp.]
MVLSSCGSLLRTDYTPPELNVPKVWNGLGNATAEAAGWPDGFGDPELSRLVKLALERNNDLAAAAFRVRQAQLKAGLAYNDQLPQFSGDISGNNKKVFDEKDWTNSYSAGFDISYEADLWGRLSRTHDSAVWEAVATNEDRLSTALSLVSTTMKLYWKIAYHNVRLRLSRRNIESSEETLGLMEAQRRYGAATDLEVNEALQDLASLRAEHWSIVQERQEDINALAVLFDMPPGKIMADPQKLINTDLPVIPAGLPADILARRPDLRAAETRLRELLANTDVARANFYPTLSLTGTLGSSSTELANLLDNPFAALASNITFPFLNWHKLELSLDESKAEYDEAVVNFRQTFYEAMKDVENALSNRDNLVRQGNRLTDSLIAARKVENIYEVRYKSGAGTLKDWLDAQDTRRKAEASVAENLYNRLVNHVTLYEALGGDPTGKDIAVPKDEEQG